MIKYTTILLIVLSSGTASGQVIISLLLGDKLNSGQVEFGLEGGINYTDMTGTNSNGLKPNFNLGFYFDIKLKSPYWLLHTGVIVKSNMGATGLPIYPLNDPNLDNAFSGGSIDRSLSYFNVPFLIKYRMANNFYLEGGPQLGLMYKAKDEFNATVSGNGLVYEVDVTDLYNKIDAGIAAGVGYRFMKGEGMNLGIRSYWGLVDTVKDNLNAAQLNRSLYVTLGIPIGAGKAREKEAKK